MARQPTRERILEGAMAAVALHGVGKLDMGDVSRSAGVSRGTLYRYFRSRDDLLLELRVLEARRFWERCLAALREAPQAEERIHLLLLQAARQVRDHPALQRMLETDPALVLRAVQREFAHIRDELHRLIGPFLAGVPTVARGEAKTEQLVDWLTRLMVSAFLIPEPDPEEMSRGLVAAYRVLTGTQPGGHTASHTGGRP